MSDQQHHIDPPQKPKRDKPSSGAKRQTAGPRNRGPVMRVVKSTPMPAYLTKAGKPSVFSLFQNLKISRVRIEIDANGRYQEFGLVGDHWAPYEELSALSRKKAEEHSSKRKSARPKRPSEPPVPGGAQPSSTGSDGGDASTQEGEAEEGESKTD